MNSFGIFEYANNLKTKLLIYSKSIKKKEQIVFLVAWCASAFKIKQLSLMKYGKTSSITSMLI